MPHSAPARRLRRDAQHNRDEVFAAAERVFARAGLGASIDEIANEAGVGVGTVYRRFGSKSALVNALFDERVGEVVRIIDDCAAAPTGAEALAAVLRAFVAVQAQSRAMQELLRGDVERDTAHLRREVEPRLTAIIERAKSEGAVRADFAATDVPLLTAAISTVGVGMAGGAALAQRHLELLLKGIVDSPDPHPVPPPLPDERFADWLRAASRPPAAVPE